MECVICKKLNLRLIPVQFEYEEIDVEEQDKILRGITHAYNEDKNPPRIILTEANVNGYIHCLAYKDPKGNPLPVHQGHCTGAYPGMERCRYYIGDKLGSSSVCWCELEIRHAERERRRAAAERERHRQEQEAALRCQQYPLDITADDIPLPWDR